jgi:hypothetical protein
MVKKIRILLRPVDQTIIYCLKISLSLNNNFSAQINHNDALNAEKTAPPGTGALIYR